MEYRVWQRLLGENAQDQKIRNEISKVRGASPSPDEIETRRRVYKFLVARETLHIVVEDALNLGHQASAATLAESLAELGYQHKFTFLAPGNITDKIIRVLPVELKDRVDVQVVPEFNPQKDYSEPAIEPPCEFAMVAAADRFDELETYRRFLGYLGATSVVLLQPYAWHRAPRLLLRQGQEPIPLSQSGDTRYRYRYQTKAPTDLLNAGLTLNLAAILTAAQKGRVALVPMYGLHRLERPERTAAYANAVAAARLAYRDKPLVLLEIGTTRIPYAPPPPDLTSIALNADDLQDRLTQLKPASAIAVTVAAVAQDVFREIYRIGDAVRFLEGANTTNYVQLVGLPYLSPRTEDTPYPDIDGLSAVKQTLDEATKAFAKLTPWAAALAEHPIYDGGALFYAYAAQNAVEADLRIPRNDHKPTLNADTVIRLIKLKDVSDFSLKEMIEEAGWRKAIEETEKYKTKLGKEDFVGEPPDVLILDDNQARALRDKLDTLITRYGDEIAKELAECPNLNKSNDLELIVKVMQLAAEKNSQVRQYFRDVQRQAMDYQNDQVLQALATYTKTS